MDAFQVNLDEIFMWVARASLYAVVVIAVIVLAQTLTRRVLAAKWICALWVILLLRLVIPAGPESGWSLWNLTPQRWTQQMFSESDPAPTVSEGQVTFGPSITGNGTTFSPGEDFSLRSTLRTFLPGVWLAGALFIMCGIIIGNLRLWNTVRRLPFVTDHALLELFEECRQSMNVRTMVGLVVTERVSSPILFGFIRPRILLPADLARELPPERLRYILLHEFAHLKRRDILTGWIFAFLQALHWFNPLVWWAFGRIRFDRELACDEQVLSRVPEEERRHYGDVLIGMLERSNHIQHLPAIAGILENKDQLKRRLVMIRKFRRPARREIITASALLAVLSIALLTEPRSLLSKYQSNENGADIQVVNAGHGEIRIFMPHGRNGATVDLSSEVDGSDQVIVFSSGIKIDDFEQLVSQLKERIKEEQSVDNLNFLEFRRMQDGALVTQDGTIIEPGDRLLLPRGRIYGAITGQDEMISVYYNQMPSELFEPGAEQKTPLKPAPTSSADMEQRTAEMKPAPTRPADTEQKTLLKPAPTSSADMGSNSGSGGDISDDLQQPEIRLPEVLANPRPDYTEEARAARIEGFIVLKVMVRKDGGVDVISVERGLGYGMDEVAIDVITTRWRFRPATQDGVPIDHPAVIEVSFKLF